MVYLWKKNGMVFHHTDLDAAAQLDSLTTTPDMTISEADFYAADGIVRLLNGEIVLGKTEAEKAAEEKQAEIAALKTELAGIDREAGAGRAIRGLALQAAKIAHLNTKDNEDFVKLQKYEDKAAPLRVQIEQLKKQLEQQQNQNDLTVA